MVIPTDIELRAFLLGRMSAEDAARLEEAIILEDGVAERLRAEEFDLIDDYAAGRLMAADRADVERHLLTSVENVHSLRVARLMMAREDGVRDAAPPAQSATQAEVLRPRRRTARLAAMGALMAAGLAAVVLIPYWDRTPRRPVGVPAPADSAIRAPGPARSPTEATDSLPILTLLADVSRGSTRPTLHWRADLASVRLQAEVPGPERSTLYSLSVYDIEGHRLFEGAALSVHVAGRYRFVDTALPSTALGPGPRTISLRASDAAEDAPAEYTWQVVGVPD
jgi:hypothetical protein